MGDVLAPPLAGRMDLRIFACRFGSSLASSRLFFSVSRFACRINVFTLFRCCACRCLFSGVGLFFMVLCSWCCCLICRLSFVVVHGFRGFGIRSLSSIVRCMVVCMFWKCWLVVVVAVLFCILAISALCMAGRMVCFSLLYLLVVSVLSVFGAARVVVLWKIV